MKTLLSILAALIVIACTSAQYDQTQLADVNLYLDTDAEVDSVFVSNITQDREFQFLPFAKTMHVEFKDSINDLYNINFYTKKGFVMNQMWLNGENIIIKGKIKEKKFVVDTVIGSDLYYKAIGFRKSYSSLTARNPDSSAVNAFLFKRLEQNIDNPYSIEIAKTIFYSNQNNRKALNNLYQLLSSQPSAWRSHGLSPFDNLEKILNETSIDFPKFKFYDTQGKLTALNLRKGKQYIIDFWFIGCAPCITDHQLIKEKLDLLKSRNIEIIGISTDRDQKQWKVFLEKKNYPWLNLREIDIHDKRITREMLIQLYPTYLLIDDNANILFRSNSFSNIEDHLKI
jgi:thiol-disulfide isomerase/thioredoxin